MIAVRSRKCFLDLLRIVACFFVIVNHTNSRVFLDSTPKSLIWFASVTYFFVSKIAVPIFFMISGYLLLGKMDSWQKAFSRILRIAIVLVGCSFVYAVFRACYIERDPSFAGIMKDALNFYRKSPSNALWYLYTYMGILLMLPLLQKLALAMTRKDYHVFFVISCLFFSVLPILSHYFPRIKIYNRFQLPLYETYICMLLLGQYFARFEIKKRRRAFLQPVRFLSQCWQLM